MNKWASNWNDITDFTFISVISSHEMSGDMKLTEYLWPIVREIIKTAVENMFRDPSCGKIFRIKGYIKKGENGWLELNATSREFSLKPAPKGQEVLIVIGENLSKEAAALYLGRKPDV